MQSNLNSLIWEPMAASGEDSKKLLFHYDSHEERLKEGGLERAPTPQEAMSLIIAHLEGRLDKGLDEVALNMLERHGEFFCHASQLSGGDLIFYEYVTGLKWNGEFYNTSPDGRWHKNKREFKIDGIKTGWSKLEFIDKINPELVRYLYSRRYQELPEIIRKSGEVYIPDNNRVWPIGRACKPVLGILLDCKDRGSRGVRSKNGER